MADYTSLDDLKAALSKIPEELADEIKKASADLASQAATKASQTARMQGGVAVYVAPTIAAVGGAIVMGSSATLRNGAAVSDVMWGAAFGSRQYSQFPPVKKGGYFPYPAIEAMNTTILNRYGEAVDAALEKV